MKPLPQARKMILGISVVSLIILQLIGCSGQKTLPTGNVSTAPGQSSPSASPSKTVTPSPTTILATVTPTCELAQAYSTSRLYQSPCDPYIDTMMAPIIADEYSGYATRTQMVMNLTTTPFIFPTSTFDPAHAVTRTPAPPAQCPVIDPDLGSKTPPNTVLNEAPDVFEGRLIDYLNQGGLQELIDEDHWQSPADAPVVYDIHAVDLTGDGVAEYMMRHWMMGEMYIVKCDGGKFHMIGRLTGNGVNFGPSILDIRDMNMDGIPELILRTETCHQCDAFMIYEWDGQALQSMVRNWFINYDTFSLDYNDMITVIGSASGTIEDTDHNGTYELVYSGGTDPNPSTRILEGLSRDTRMVYMWDGHYFTCTYSEYFPAEYRFQAVQDADVAFQKNQYERALSLYQDAAFNDRLKSWSTTISTQAVVQFEQFYSQIPTATPLPPDPTETEQLAAYSLFRISLLHLVQGHVSDADTVYQGLVRDFPQGSAGHPFVEMADAFWKDYQANQSISMACSQAVQYAHSHHEILVPLSGGDMIHASARTYDPEDVCPIKE